MSLEPFILRALIAGFGIALVAGPLGCFVVWRRMAYFGDSLAHSALLGIALALFFNINIHLGMIAVGVVFAVMLVFLQQQQLLTTDTLLGILSHTALAAGIIAFSLIATIRMELFGFLFGDILTVSIRDLYWIYAGGTLILITLIMLWKPLVLMAINDDLAAAEGVKVFYVNFILMLLFAIVVAIAMRIIGVLLITALLVIPAASARQVAHSPEKMALLTVLFGAIATCLGIFASMLWDVPSGPAIILVTSLLFVLSGLARLFVFK
jgi:zinc transport system permease protein